MRSHCGCVVQEATDTYQNTVVRFLAFCLWGVAKLPIALWIYSSWINEPVEDRKKRWAPKTEANILLFWLGGWLISRAALSSLDYHGRGHILGIAKVNLYNRTTKSINETAVNMVVGGYTNEFAYSTILALHLLATVVVTTLSYFRYKRNNTKQYFKMNKRAVCMQYGISMMFLFVFLFEILAYIMINSHES